MGEKVTTIMALKVDLQCHRCYKKVKKILCKFPQIRDQVYDEKQNTVVIKVVCCSPEKIKEKIRCKGGDSIKSIEILPPPPPPKPKPDPAPKPPPAEKPKPVEKPPPPSQKPVVVVKPPDQPPKPPPAEKPKPVEKPPAPAPNPPPPPSQKPVVVEITTTTSKPPDQPPKPPPAEKPKPVEKPPAPAPNPPPPPAEPPCVPVAYPPPCLPIRVCCRQCYDGVDGGPCFHGHGGPPPSYEGHGRPVYDSYGGGAYRSCDASRCEYFSEDNPSGCTVM